ncbi:BTB/POZ domain containing protein [Acanthamoeba castellanii str. Neff]|uniref:BTB/POZ domain containing protein n=1 Tax=Acanthamoeba castellanii (strain ATCC 30010 / Neff) TaxID=1257118 RepID=L8GD31_ACACF|nr:BTB/POZ domain containing protein [Acanthamoeba castellanii str. Neff]ELR10972.1 BTB/POZ domain containing protein [Acanthamoeba castellanii str. Neff]
MEDANVIKIKVIAAEDLYVDESKEALRVVHGQSVEFRIPKTIRLLKLKKRYCEEYNLHLDGANTSTRSGVQFKFGNRTIDDNDTVCPSSLPRPFTLFFMHRDADERSFVCGTGGGQCGSLCLTTNDVIKVHHTPEFHCYLNSTSVPGKTLQSDMRELYLEAMRSGGHGSTDVVFNVGKEKVHAHKLILTARCEKLRAMFSSSFAEYNEQKTGEVAIEGHDPSTFRLMLEWIYCDNVQMPTTAEGCLQLLALAEEMLLFPLKTTYHVDFLKQKCKQYIMDHYDEMLREQPEFEKELCKVPELLVELTRSALSREEPRRYVVLETSIGSPSTGRGEKRRRGN